MKIALFQPDIPQNTGTIMRSAACLGVAVDLIEPLGFILSDKHLRRAGMDYLDMVEVIRHSSWQAFLATHRGLGGSEQKADKKAGRLVLLTTTGATPYLDFEFEPTDTIIMGSEGSGVPKEVHDNVDARLVIPMAKNARSLNVAVASAMVLGEAIRQTT